MRKALAAAALLAAGLLFWRLVPGGPLEVTLPAGVNAAQAGVLLRQDGVIFSATLFRLAARWSGEDRRLHAGTYRLRRRMRLGALLLALRDGSRSPGIRVAIPEGFASWQIAQRLEAAGVCKASAFLRYVRGDNPEGRGLEGYLFPTTYYFDPDTPAAQAAERMRAEFASRVVPEFIRARGRSNLTLFQTMTLASIVEREAERARERPLIAGVYWNRLRRRMRLEADPTVQYALGRWKSALSLDDLRLDSPYNTYVHYGLPPGPICSFGLESFRAALHPAATDALYFVADGRGGHVFSATLAEHLRAKRALKRRLLRGKGRSR